MLYLQSVLHGLAHAAHAACQRVVVEEHVLVIRAMVKVFVIVIVIVIVIVKVK